MERIEKLKAFLAQNPEDSFVQHALALEYVKLNDEEAARQQWEALLKRDEAYVGSYYHLAKLLERQGKTEDAITIYEKGMQVAKAASDGHAYNELQMAYEDLID
ncbi:MAG TPA: tetratricopeptide repeat protein [Flavisolibacter sp.]|nr:tetratricopeptide repeat protein [Flavisolibacter sp.]